MITETDNEIEYYSQFELEVEFLTYWIKRDNPDMLFDEVRKEAIKQAKEAHEDISNF